MATHCRPTAPTELRAGGVEVIVHPPEKDESDTELALSEALARGATSIVVIGAFGGQRLEHTIANLLLLYLPALASVDMRLVDGPSEVRVIGHNGSMAHASDRRFGGRLRLAYCR